MLTFLRKIRKSLIESGSSRKYLLYAIGEILLVMIGILLALQVNNWNENRNARTLELKLLSQMKAELTGDMDGYLINRIERSRRYITDIDDLLSWIDSDMPYHDSLNRKYYVLSASHGITLSSGAFNSVESIGIQIIRNDDLRQKVVSLFSQSIPYLDYTYENNRNNVLDFGRPLLRSAFDNVNDSYEPLDIAKLKNEVLLKNVLKSIRTNNHSILDALNRVADESRHIVELINYELSLAE